MGSSSANLGPPTSSAAQLQPRIMKAVLFLTLVVTLSLMLDLSNSFWITRSRMGRNRFGRFGSSDPDMVDDDAVEYEDNDLLDDLANAILDRQEKVDTLIFSTVCVRKHTNKFKCTMLVSQLV